MSYLPYLKSDDQSIFYQKFLFRSCLDLYNESENLSQDSDVYVGEEIEYAQDLCKVYTEDYQNFVLKIIDEHAVWSD